MSSRCVEVTSVAKVNKKLLVTRFCIAMRAQDRIVAAQSRVDRQARETASFWIPPLT